MPVCHSTGQRLRPRDAETVVCLGHLCAQFTQFVRHDRDTVGLFDAQFLSITHHGLALGTQRGHHEHGEFVNHPHHDLATDL